MNKKAFDKLSDDLHTDYSIPRLTRLIEGMTLLASKGDVQRWDIAAEHDELFADGPEPTDEAWTEDELRRLLTLGWFWDDEVDSWATFC
jgi:hypothetical protein